MYTRGCGASACWDRVLPWLSQVLTLGCAIYLLLEVGDDCQKWNARIVICLVEHLASRESCSPRADATVSAASAAAAATCHWSGIGLNALHN